MTARWRQPLRVVASEPGNEVFLDSGGVLRRSMKVIFDRESTERIRTGYACANCFEVFEVPWPLHCTFCGAPIRERQMEYFQREYDGEIDLETNWVDELAGLEERRQKNKELTNGNT